MKVRRYKRAQRIVSIFRTYFSFKPPYCILLDGTFAMAALQNKINLREQTPKYLNAVSTLICPQFLAKLLPYENCFYVSEVGCLPFP